MPICYNVLSERCRVGRDLPVSVRSSLHTGTGRTQLKPGDSCPIAYCTGKLCKLKPSAIFKIDGASKAHPINYSIDRLRCALCGKVQKPTHDSPEGKYTDKSTSQLILYKYFLARPMYRLDGYQKIVGVPHPNSTQWDIINDAYQALIIVSVGSRNSRVPAGKPAQCH